MFIQLTSLRRNRDGVPYPNGKLTVNKSNIAAVSRDSYYTETTNIYLTSGQVLPVMEKIKEVEEFLLSH